MTKAEALQKPMLRDQQRAQHAYNAVSAVPSDKQSRDNYKIAVNDLGANILRGGLCAAIASVQRLNKGSDKRGDILLDHLASANVPGLEGATKDNLAEKIRKLDVASYMIVTRELLLVATWLKRAVQATFGET
jgi:CRISPR-associated protein Cmr5